VSYRKLILELELTQVALVQVAQKVVYQWPVYSALAQKVVYQWPVYSALAPVAELPVAELPVAELPVAELPVVLDHIYLALMR
jgi:hypothetical protein